MSASSKRPWMVPSSPKVPWRTGKMTSSDWAREPFCCARASWRSATPALARSATDLVVVRFFWIGAGFVLPASRCWASAEVIHWPCLVMPMGITSYFVWSMDLRMEAAERRETSCSPERPPKRMPMRSFWGVGLVVCFFCFVMDRYKSLLNLVGSAGKKCWVIEVVFLRGVLLIFMFLVVVFCGEDVVICVADVVFWQSLF